MALLTVRRSPEAANSRAACAQQAASGAGEIRDERRLPGRRSVLLLGAVAAAAMCLGPVAAVASAAQGGLDPTFGSAGKVITNFDPQGDGALGTAVQGDGKVVAVGNTSSGGLLVRYNADGGLDQGFGNGGKVITTTAAPTPGGQASLFFPQAVAFQPGGKILVAGLAYLDPSSGRGGLAVVRYASDGTLDTSFGEGDGIVAANIPPPPSEEFGSNAYDLAIQPDGKIVAAGIADSYNFGTHSYAAAIVRFTPDGRPDETFGTGGQETRFIGSSGTDVPQDVGLALQPDGKSVLATRGGPNGPSANSQGDTFFLARFTALGRLDSSFGVDGVVSTNFRTFSDEQGRPFPSVDSAKDVAVQGDGKIVAAGFSGRSLSENFEDPQRDFAVARYNADGSLDQGFGSGGKVITDAGGKDSAEAIALQADGKIVTAGENASEYAGGRFTRGDFVLFRYRGDGSLDPGFGDGGKVTTPFGPNHDIAKDLAITPADGKIVAAGFSEKTDADFSDFALARYEGQPPGGGNPPGGGGTPPGGGGTPPGGGGSPPGGLTSSGTTGGSDLSAPGVTGYGLTNNPFVVGGGKTPTFGSAAVKKHKKGTTFRYTLSEAATVKIVIAQRRSGRRKGKRCVAPTRKLRTAKKCIRLTTRGTLTRTSHQGANRVAFSGRTGSKALSPGSYQATLTATDAAKNTSRGQVVTFTIVKR